MVSRIPSEAQWQRLTVVFGGFFVVTLAVAVLFITASPFPPLVGALIMSPLVVPTAWLWIMVILRRDADRLNRVNAWAVRYRRRGRSKR